MNIFKLHKFNNYKQMKKYFGNMAIIKLVDSCNKIYLIQGYHIKEQYAKIKNT